MGKYKYLLWDIDGTIFDFEAAERASIRSLFQKYDLGTCTDEMLKRYSSINKRYWKALERGEMTKGEILVRRFSEFLTSEGLDGSIATEFNADYQLCLGDTIVFHDDALEIIRQLKGRYIQVVITNGTQKAQEKKLSRSGLDKLMDYTFISELVGCEKPGLDFFSKVMSDVGIGSPEDALIIGDSLTSDILGGINSGIDTCWYNPCNAGNDGAIKPTYTIGNLHEIFGII